MGAYTETCVRLDKLTKEQTERIVNHLIDVLKYQNKCYDGDAVERLFRRRQELRDLYQKMGLTEEKLTKKYIEKEVKSKIKIIETKLHDLNEVLIGNMTLEGCLRKNHMLKRYSDANVKKFNDHYYIETYDEIFRNYEYDKLSINLHTVEDLINHLKTRDSIQDLTIPDDKFGPLTPELEIKIRKHYSEIGDNNFIVNFG